MSPALKGHARLGALRQVAALVPNLWSGSAVDRSELPAAMTRRTVEADACSSERQDASEATL